MFAKPFRLPYSSNLRNAKQLGFLHFRLKYQQNNLSNNRYGFIIGKAIDKRAVVRNRTKRILRSEVEILHPNLKQGFDFLFFIKQPIAKENNQRAREEIREFFRREKLFAE